MGLVKKTLPVAVYRKGLRYVVGEAMIEIDEDLKNAFTDWSKVEIDITNPILSEIKLHEKQGDFSIGRSQ
jgi:hypothetical protein